MQTWNSAGVSNPFSSLSIPPRVFERLHHEYDFTLDVAGEKNAHRAPTYFSQVEDGRVCQWRTGELGTAWCCPHFGSPAEWLGKAMYETRFGGFCNRAVLLFPATLADGWLTEAMTMAEIHLFDGPLQPADDDLATRSGGTALIVVERTPYFRGVTCLRSARTGRVVFDFDLEAGYPDDE